MYKVLTCNFHKIIKVMTVENLNVLIAINLLLETINVLAAELNLNYQKLA